MIIGGGGPSDSARIDLQTRRKNHIANERLKPRAPAALAAAAKMHERPGIENRSLDSTYNCMGMVFGCRRTAIDPCFFSLIQEDDGYRKLTPGERPRIGDIAVYTSTGGAVVHVGVVFEAEAKVDTCTSKITVLSQWGFDGEYIHPLDDYPVGLEVGSGKLGRSIWTERDRNP